MKTFTPVLAMAALALPAVNAAVAAIVNRCPSSVYVWSVGDVQSAMVALPNQTIGYSEPYRSKIEGGGISIKFAPYYTGDDELDYNRNISQFEYTLDTASNKIWYDISFVNGNAFEGVPVLLQPSDTTCPNVTCAAADTVCKQAYNIYNDDFATHACGVENDLILTLCTNNTEVATSGSGSSSGSTSDSTSTSENSAVTLGANGDVQIAAPQTNSAPNSKVVTSTTNEADFDSLSQISETGVVSWVSYTNPSSKREASEPAHHNHEYYHRIRRSRVFRASE